MSETGQPLPIEWAVIGAATNGRKKYQPEPTWIANIIDLSNELRIPVFFKGNLEWDDWRDHFPESPPITYEPMPPTQAAQTILF